MNQRIKELAEQAEKYADDNFKGEPTYSEAYDSKFAELIVRECIDICHKMAEESDSYTVHDGDTCAEQIKQHFGVEE